MSAQLGFLPIIPVAIAGTGLAAGTVVGWQASQLLNPTPRTFYLAGALALLALLAVRR